MLTNYLFMVISILISIAFLTLSERKVLSYIQLRKGPNKISLSGLLQPMADGLKLFIKSVSIPSLSNTMAFKMAPMIMMIIMLMSWLIYSPQTKTNDFSLSISLFLALSGMMVYGIILAGWSSGSLYSLLGSYRGVAQTISYEVSMSFILLSIIMITLSFNIDSPYHVSMIIMASPLIPMMWFISILAEMNRTPFDLAEGESELVSGFNTEYSAITFSLIFLAEYGMILFMSYFTSVMFSVKYLFTMILFTILWVRGTLPRMRYDKMMDTMWKTILLMALVSVIFTFYINSMMKPIISCPSMFHLV